VAASSDVLDTAVTLCGVHGLRAYDAIQLASAVRARAVDATLTELVTYDVSLHRAAAAEGFLVNPLS
jgi:predicted nucleic acid-binding protein